MLAPRYVGLAGSLALAAGAWQVGALPGRAAGDSLPGRGQAAGMLACAVGLVALTIAWWRSRDSEQILTSAALWALPLLFAPPIASRDIYAYACQGGVFRAGASPATTSPADLPCAWLDSVPPIWQDATSPYGPLFTLLSAASGANLPVAVGVLRALALIGIVIGIRYGRQLALASGVEPARAAWLAVASPLVLVHAIGGAHNDALMAGLILAGLAMAMKGNGFGAGTALGLAAAVKITALLALPFALIPLKRRWQAVVALAIVYIGLAWVTGNPLGFVKALGGTADLKQWTSIPTALGMTVGYATGQRDASIAVARVLGIAAMAAVIAIVWWRARQGRLTPARAAGIAFAALVLLGPVFYPWYALTPLALLAVSTVDDRVRAWLGVAAGSLAFLILPNGAGLAPRTKLPGALLVTAATVTAVVRKLRTRAPARGA